MKNSSNQTKPDTFETELVSLKETNRILSKKFAKTDKMLSKKFAETDKMILENFSNAEQRFQKLEHLKDMIPW